MRKKTIFRIIIFIILLVFIGIMIIKIDFNNLVRLPVKRNVILDHNDIIFTNINIVDNDVNILGELNIQNDESLKEYTIENVDIRKNNDILYVVVTGGYGVGEDKQRFVIDEHFNGEKVKKIILKGRRFRSKVIWNSD